MVRYAVHNTEVLTLNQRSRGYLEGLLRYILDEEFNYINLGIREVRSVVQSCNFVNGHLSNNLPKKIEKKHLRCNHDVEIMRLDRQLGSF